MISASEQAPTGRLPPPTRRLDSLSRRIKLIKSMLTSAAKEAREKHRWEFLLTMVLAGVVLLAGTVVLLAGTGVVFPNARGSPAELGVEGAVVGPRDLATWHRGVLGAVLGSDVGLLEEPQASLTPSRGSDVTSPADDKSRAGLQSPNLASSSDDAGKHMLTSPSDVRNDPPSASLPNSSLALASVAPGSNSSSHSDDGAEETGKKARNQQLEPTTAEGTAASTVASTVAAASEPAAPALGSPEDWEEVKRLRELITPLARNSTVAVIPANLGFLDLALNLRCRLLALGSSNILFWALDKATSEDLQRRGIPSYFDERLFSTSKATGFHDRDYIRMMSERPRVWWRLLATGFNFAFLDADIVAFDPPEVTFEMVGDLEGGVNGWGWDFELERTNRSHLCAGAFWMRASEKGMKFMEKAYESFAGRAPVEKRWDDQMALNWILHDPTFSDVISANVPEGQKFRSDVGPEIFKVVLYDPRWILPGHLFWGSQLSGKGYDISFTTKRHPKDANDTSVLQFRPSLFHLSGHGDKAGKVGRMKENGWWELNEQMECRATE